jgi:acyl dehydratase
MPTEKFSLANSKAFVGQELGVSGWITLNQQRIDQFAECTEDHQWIHVDVERAKRDSPSGPPSCTAT